MASGAKPIHHSLGMCVYAYLQNIFSLFKSQRFYIFLAKLQEEKNSMDVSWPNVIFLPMYARIFYINAEKVSKLSKLINLKCQDK